MRQESAPLDLLHAVLRSHQGKEEGSTCGKRAKSGACRDVTAVRHPLGDESVGPHFAGEGKRHSLALEDGAGLGHEHQGLQTHVHQEFLHGFVVLGLHVDPVGVLDDGHVRRERKAPGDRKTAVLFRKSKSTRR